MQAIAKRACSHKTKLTPYHKPANIHTTLVKKDSDEPVVNADAIRGRFRVTGVFDDRNSSVSPKTRSPAYKVSSWSVAIATLVGNGDIVVAARLALEDSE